MAAQKEARDEAESRGKTSVALERWEGRAETEGTRGSGSAGRVAEFSFNGCRLTFIGHARDAETFGVSRVNPVLDLT